MTQLEIFKSLTYNNNFSYQSYLKFEDFDVNEIVCDNLRIFDLFLTSINIHQKESDHDLIFNNLKQFLNRKKLIITANNLMIIDRYIREYHIFVRDVNELYKLYWLVSTNESANKLEYYHIMMHNNIIEAINSFSIDYVKMILCSPKYDMRKNVSLLYVCIDLFGITSDDSYEYDLVVDIIESITEHPTFVLPHLYHENQKFINESSVVKKILNDYYYESLPSRMLVLIIGYTDDYLLMKDDCSHERYFNIIKELPFELQMKISNMIYDRTDDFISPKQINKNLDILDSI